MQIDLKQPILQKNDAIASELRERFAENHVFVLDLLASPGSGKTSTILATIDALRDEFNIAVIEGDIASNVTPSASRPRASLPCRLNTGGACHLESAMLKRAVDVLDLARLDLIDRETWQLVCPRIRSGRDAKVMILSVPRATTSRSSTRRVPGGRGRGAEQGRTPCPCSTSTARRSSPPCAS